MIERNQTLPTLPSEHPHEITPSRILAERLIHVDDNLIVLDKPAGWLSVPSRLGTKDPRPCVGTSLQENLRTLGMRGRQVWPVHRLDYEVSGILIFALNRDIHRTLCQMFEHRLVRKTYEAWALQRTSEDLFPKNSTTTVSQQLEFDPKIHHWYTWQSMIVRGKKRSFEAPHGQPATTRALWQARLLFPRRKNLTQELQQWFLIPETGRSHQLRFEMFKHGLPLVGDTLYGGIPWFQQSNLSQPDTIALRCVRIEFEEIPLADPSRSALAIQPRSSPTVSHQTLSLPGSFPRILETNTNLINNVQDLIL